MINFLKMHGLGNDFIVIDERKEIKVPEELKHNFAKKKCNRKFSVGADGVLFLQSSKNHDLKMRIFNSDGGEAENCVNGVRCVAFAFYEIDKLSGIHSFNIDTLAGLVRAKVEMKSENLAEVEIEVLGKREYLGKKSITIDDKEFLYHSVNVGNPHAVIFLEESVDDFPVENIGHKMEYHEQFQPDRKNTEFVNVLGKTHLKMRVHERGVCETMACGSGSIATVIAACESGLTSKDEWITVEQFGGKLEISFGRTLKLRGPAEISFAGTTSFKSTDMYERSRAADKR